MLLLDMDFLYLGALKWIYTNKEQVLGIYPNLSVRNIKVLDTNTGKIIEIQLNDLFRKPLRPFEKKIDIQGQEFLAYTAPYLFSELKEKVIRIDDTCFYFTNFGTLILYEHTLYYKFADRSDTGEYTGFSKLREGRYSYTINSITDKGYLKSPYFVADYDLEESVKIEDNVTFKDFNDNVLLYVTKLKLLGYKF